MGHELTATLIHAPFFFLRGPHHVRRRRVEPAVLHETDHALLREGSGFPDQRLYAHRIVPERFELVFKTLQLNHLRRDKWYIPPAAQLLGDQRVALSRSP